MERTASQSNRGERRILPFDLFSAMFRVDLQAIGAHVVLLGCSVTNSFHKAIPSR